jgi:hypothetical protein
MASTERLEQMGTQPLNNDKSKHQRDDTLEELLQPRRGRKKRVDKDSIKSVNFVLSLDLIERLGHYCVHQSRVEGRNVTNSEVVERALHEFLTREGYPIPPQSSD